MFGYKKNTWIVKFWPKANFAYLLEMKKEVNLDI